MNNYILHTLELHCTASLYCDCMNKSQTTVLPSLLLNFITLSFLLLLLSPPPPLPAVVIMRCRSSKLPLLNYTSCLNMEQILLFWDQPAPQGSGQLHHPLILAARRPHVTLRRWFIPIIWDPGDPSAVTSQSQACLSTDLVAVKDKLM